ADTLTFAWAVTKDGQPLASSLLRDFTFTPEDNGSYHVALTVRDDDGGVGTATADVLVGNVNPQATITSAPGSSPGVISLGSLVTDPGAADVGSFTYLWTVTNAVPLTPANGPTFRLQPTGGTVRVVLTVTDKDGGVGSDVAVIVAGTAAPDTVSV